MSKTNNMAAIAVNKSLLKEYVSSEGPRTVYLNDGDEFQIKLFNPENVRISAMIYIDGQYLGNDIILRPGENLWLERYLDKARKFRFETYEVESGNAAVEKAIRNNGEIEIRFFREKPRKTNPIQIVDLGHVDLGHSAYLGERGISTPIFQPLYSKGIVGSGTGDVCLNDVTTVSTSATVSDFSFSTSASTASPQATLDWVQPETKETGRVSEGAYSNQRFMEVNVDVEEWAFHTEKIKILPRSRKPFTKNDLNKVFCANCGRKIKSKFKFCPFCGAEQD